MAKLRQVLGHDTERLLRHAAAAFLRPPRATPADPFPSPADFLALRQGGIRDDLVRLAAAERVRGWFDPPLCTFAELPARLGSTALAPCGDVARRVLLERVLRRADGGVLGRVADTAAFVGAVDRLFGELAAERVAADALVHAMERVADRDDFEVARDADLTRAYREYLVELREAGMRDGRDSIADCAEAVAGDAEGLARRLGGRRRVLLFGLNDLRGGWRRLLAALEASAAVDEVVVYASHPLDVAGSVEWIDGEVGGGAIGGSASGGAASGIAWGAPPEHQSAIAEPPAYHPFPAHRTTSTLAAPDTERELDEVARRIRLLADAGTPLHRIAVVARQARPHVDLAVDALDRAGVPATARRRHALAEIPAVGALLALLDAAADGWPRRAVAGLAEHPYLDLGIDPAVVAAIAARRHVAGLDAWLAALADLESIARSPGDGREVADDGPRSRPVPAPARIAEARAAFATFAARARHLDRRHTAAAWLDWLRAAVDDDAWGIRAAIYRVPHERYDRARIDLAGWRALALARDEWRAAAGLWGADDEQRLDAAAFAARLREHLDADAALWSESAAGVQVLEAPAAAYRRFDHVFLVGVESGVFPARPHRSPVLDERERAALVDAGLPIDAPTAWETRERELFETLAGSAAVSLTLSWARVDAGGRESARSSFVEDAEAFEHVARVEIPARQVVTPGQRLHRGGGAPAHARRAAAVERLRATGRPSAWNGVVADPVLRAWLADAFGEARVWSATQLESYAKCPWAFFATRLLALETSDETESDVAEDRSITGGILHEVLRRTWDLLGRERDGQPVVLAEEDRARVGRHLERELEDVVADVSATRWLGNPVLLAAKKAELKRQLSKWLDFELEQQRLMRSNRSKKILSVRTGVVAHELEFGGISIDLGDGLTIRLRGSIDRVEVGVDDRIDGAGELVAAVDYKSSKASTPGGGDKAAWDDGAVVQLPLYALALERLYPGKTVARIEYRTLRAPDAVHVLQLHQLDKAKTKLEASPADAARISRAIEHVRRHVRSARDGRFPAAPAPSNGCPPWCVGRDICRVKGGPRAGGAR